MTKQECYPGYADHFEYHGSTSIEVTRTQAGMVVQKKWLLFDSVEEAMDFFDVHCGA